MANYKPVGNSNFILAGGTIHYLKANQTLRTLNFGITGQNAEALRDSSDYSVYQVPSGKTFTCLGITVTGGGFNYLIYQGDTEDALTLLKNTVALPSAQTVEMATSGLTFAATKFITIDPSGISSYTITMIGYES